MCRNVVGGLAALVLVASQAVAQNAAPPRQAGTQPQRAATVPGATAGVQPGQPGQQSVTQVVDQAIAACLLLGNQEEVALAQFAQEHAKSDEVKKFAKMMSDDHKQAIQKLRQIAPQLAWLGENLEQDSSSQPGAGASQSGSFGAQPGTQPGAQDGVAQAGFETGAQRAGSDPIMGQMLSLQQRVAQECLKLTQDELGKSENFDQCYIGQQVGAHIGMLAKLKGSEQFESPQLQSFIDEATKTVEKHLDKAKQIAKSYEDQSRSGSGRAANRSEDSRH